MYVFRNVNDALIIMCNDIMDTDGSVSSRAGETRELRNVSIQLTHPLEREILIPERRHSYVAQIAETMWVLAGRNDVEWLERYLPRAAEFSDDGETWRAGYGPRLRNFHGVDQVQFVIDLLKEDPETRRAVISLWDPQVDTQPGKDIPCNNWLHFMKRDGVLNLAVSVRSNDLIWGWSGINQFEWSVLLEIVAFHTQSEVGSLTFHISSLHIYERHWDRARKIAAASIPDPVPAQYRYQSEGLRAIDNWMRVEEAVRNGETISHSPYNTLFSHFLSVVSAKWNVPIQSYNSAATVPTSSFIYRVIALHNQKHEAYGDSWMKRGELFSIIPNIARKIDRLDAGGETDDETQADTAIDLFVYLAKYRCWLTEFRRAPSPIVEIIKVSSWTVTPDAANRLIRSVKTDNPNQIEPVQYLVRHFEELIQAVQEGSDRVWIIVDDMLPMARYHAEQLSK